MIGLAGEWALSVGIIGLRRDLEAGEDLGRSEMA
jgi:hypothetical protein